MKIADLLPALLIGGGAWFVLRNAGGIAQATGTVAKPADSAGTQPKTTTPATQTPAATTPAVTTPAIVVQPATVYIPPASSTVAAGLQSALMSAGVPADVAAIAASQSADGKTYPDSFLQDVNKNAALGMPGWVRLSDVGGVRHNAWEWNYYRELAGGNNPGDMFQDMSASRAASEYIAAIAQGGLSGMGRIYRRRRASV